MREAEQGLSEARQRVWAAESACYYAHRRYVQSGAEADQAVWLTRNKERVAAVAGLQRAERTLAEARERADAGGGGG